MVSLVVTVSVMGVDLGGLGPCDGRDPVCRETVCFPWHDSLLRALGNRVLAGVCCSLFYDSGLDGRR